MANVLSRAISWLVEFVREVDRGIAVGYGYEPPEKVGRRGSDGFQTRRSVGRRHPKVDTEVRDDR